MTPHNCSIIFYLLMNIFYVLLWGTFCLALPFGLELSLWIGVSMRVCVVLYKWGRGKKVNGWTDGLFLYGPMCGLVYTQFALELKKKESILLILCHLQPQDLTYASTSSSYLQNPPLFHIPPALPNQFNYTVPPPRGPLPPHSTPQSPHPNQSASD